MCREYSIWRHYDLLKAVSNFTYHALETKYSEKVLLNLLLSVVHNKPNARVSHTSVSHLQLHKYTNHTRIHCYSISTHPHTDINNTTQIITTHILLPHIRTQTTNSFRTHQSITVTSTFKPLQYNHYMYFDYRPHDHPFNRLSFTPHSNVRARINERLK